MEYLSSFTTLQSYAKYDVTRNWQNNLRKQIVEKKQARTQNDAPDKDLKSRAAEGHSPFLGVTAECRRIDLDVSFCA